MSDMGAIKYTFNIIKHQTDTDLLNEYWSIISASKTSNICWESLGTGKLYNQSSKLCLLCINEKPTIAPNKGNKLV